MIRHIVMWKLDAAYSIQEKSNLLKEFTAKLDSLFGKIQELKSISTHLNSEQANQSNYDLMLETAFDTIEGLNAYQTHPEHLKVVEFVKTLKTQRACIDYEY